MKPRRLSGVVGLGLVGALAAACSVQSGSIRASASAPPTTVSPTAAATGYGGRPIDASLTPVSASHPSPAAAAALESCGVPSPYPINQVVGMALISRARELPKYVGLPDFQLEIQNDDPAWVIQFQGPIAQPWIAEIWTDPICVRFKARSVNSGYFAAQPAMPVAGITPDPGIAPTLALPPLAP
jgi:hypothetical protein